MNKLLSVIISVYKVEPYIRRCLDSLIIDPALMEKMDILIINDGTPDRSANISREYVKRFPGVFRQIDKENGGHGSVWNLGVKEAYGKYIKFLDSDDWLENVEEMNQRLAEADADLIITSCISHCRGGRRWKLKIKDMEFGRVYDADEFDWLGNRSHGNYILHHCAIYKTEMLRQYLPLFLEKQPYDDLILGVAPIIGAKTLVAWDLEMYHYTMDREGQSVSRKEQRKNMGAIIRAYKSIIDFITQHPVENPDSTKRLFFSAKLPQKFNYGITGPLEMIPYKEAKSCSREWDEWVKENYPAVHTRWLHLYRTLPFFIYWTFFQINRPFFALYKTLNY